MNKKIVNINENKVLPFKQTRLTQISTYFILKSKLIKNYC